jgi:outer membrane protein assembly factor BamB
MLALALFLVVLAGPALAAPADQILPRSLPIPGPTEWRPIGCRSVPFEHPVLLPRTAFRRAHGDLDSSDEVALAYAPVFDREWIAEPSLYQVTTPSFDGAGNLYMTPLLPYEPILMISLDPESGARRFFVPLEPGDRGGGVVPLVLREPETGTEVVYVNAYRRVLAVRTDGTVAWETATGLGDATVSYESPIGLAWVPNADAIVGLTRDGYVFLLDRRTGTPLLPEPLQLPGERTPSVELDIPPAVAADVDALLRPLVNFSQGSGVVPLIEVLLGGDSEVANNLSVDARRGRLWIAASARDSEDGRLDGLSELGALYRFDVVPDGAAGGFTLAEVCHRSFSGGSASTPTLGQNGARVYLGDDAGALLAIDAEDCSEIWSVPIGSQIFGSVAVASDGREIYASTQSGIFQVFDDGDEGRRGWTAALDLYDVPAELAGYVGMNILLAGAGANGLLIQTGVGLVTGARTLPVRTGIAHVDRSTGKARWFADGLEESLGAMSTGPDGALYLPHAPLRRAFSLAVGLTEEPLVGGISKWSATRYDLLARDAACAAADRAANALDFLETCPESAIADLAQVDALRAQMLDAAERASMETDLSEPTARRLRQSTAGLLPPSGPATAEDAERYHRIAVRVLGDACDLLSSRETFGGRGCLALGSHSARRISSSGRFESSDRFEARSRPRCLSPRGRLSRRPS